MGTGGTGTDHGQARVQPRRGRGARALSLGKRRGPREMLGRGWILFQFPPMAVASPVGPGAPELPRGGLGCGGQLAAGDGKAEQDDLGSKNDVQAAGKPSRHQSQENDTAPRRKSVLK